MMKKFIVLPLLLLNTFISCSQQYLEVNTKVLDQFTNALIKHDMALGSLAIMQNDSIVYENGFGYSIMHQNDKKSTESTTNYRIGSVTKMFTAVLIFQLIEKEKLHLDDTLGKFFSSIKNADKITIENLLGHSSGIVDYTSASDFDEWKYGYKSKDELFEILNSLPSSFTPSQRKEYSNSNYLLLSFIIEEILDREYHKIVKENIISKLGLTNTYYETELKENLRNSESYKYQNAQWKEQRNDNVGIHKGAGALVSTPVDLTIFINALFNNKLIDSKSLVKMTRTSKEYGLGIFEFNFDGIKGYGHEGRINEYYTSLLYIPANNVAISHCSNGILYPRDDIIKKVVKICHGDPVTIPDFKSENIKPQNLDTFIGKYKSKFMPIEVVCEKKNDQLTIETKGTTFKVKPIENNYFMNVEAGYFFEFIPSKDQLLIKETDNVYLLEKE